MFGTYFYHKRVRSAVSVFGSLFNNLYVLRKNSAGQTIFKSKYHCHTHQKETLLQGSSP